MDESSVDQYRQDESSVDESSVDESSVDESSGHALSLVCRHTSAVVVNHGGSSLWSEATFLYLLCVQEPQH